MRHRPLAALGFVALALAAGCDERLDPITGTFGSGAGTADFNVTPQTLSLTRGQSAQITLNSTRAIGPYTWSTSQEGVATVTNTGLVNAVGNGTANITVRAAGDPNVSARTTVTVTGTTAP